MSASHVDLSRIGYPVNNMATVLAMVTTEERLDQVDRANTRIFDRHLERRHFAEAFEFLAGWLTTTEHTRRRVQGPGPDPADVVGEFAACVVRQVELHRTLSSSPGSVNVTRPSSLGFDGTGTKDSNLTDSNPGATVESAASPVGGDTPESCAPGDIPARHLSLVDALPRCGHVDERTGMVCAEDPGHPAGEHYYRTAARA